MNNKRSYRELRQLKTFKERFEYLSTNSLVGDSTFGFNRYLNQRFYQSPEWKKFRRAIIIRDNGGEMGLVEYPINGRIIIHHINPISEDDLLTDTSLMDPNNVICVSHQMHNAIHYGTYESIGKDIIIREQGDTKLW